MQKQVGISGWSEIAEIGKGEKKVTEPHRDAAGRFSLGELLEGCEQYRSQNHGHVTMKNSAGSKRSLTGRWSEFPVAARP